MVTLPVIATTGAPEAKPTAHSGRNQNTGVEESGPADGMAAANCNDRDFGTSHRQLSNEATPTFPAPGRGSCRPWQGTIVGEAKERPAFFAAREWDAGLFAFARRDRVFTRGLRDHHQIEW